MIDKLYSTTQKPRAIIFCEKKFSALGKTLNNYIKSIVCKTIPFCNKCQYCQKIDSGTYRDLIIFDGSKQAIKKDDIAFIQNQFNLAPFEKCGKKIYVLINVSINVQLMLQEKKPCGETLIRTQIKTLILTLISF